MDISTKVLAKVIVLTPDRKVLLLKRSARDPKGPLLWDLPGGTVEEAETFDVAACRESYEEAGLQLEPLDVRLIYTKTGMFENGNRCWLFFYANGDEASNIVLSDEHEAYEWVPLVEACKRGLFQVQEEALQYVFQYGH